MISKQAFYAMGCHMSALLDSPSRRADRRLASVPAWFEVWEECLSRFRPTSELQQVNAGAGQPVKVSQTFAAVLEAARRAYFESGGLVSPAVLDALLNAGYDRTFTGMLGEVEQAASAMRRGASDPAAPLESIQWDAATRSLRLPPGVRLDFGGVAKGWAAHQAMLRLKICGPALVDAGGDIAISGLQAEGRPWPVGIIDPFQPERDMEIVNLGQCGVATSGRDYRRWKSGSDWKHHIIDPRTGQPANTDLISVTVIAANVLRAEMAAKTVMISGSRLGLSWLESQPDLAALLVLEDGQRLYSQNFARRFAPRQEVLN